MSRIGVSGHTRAGRSEPADCMGEPRCDATPAIAPTILKRFSETENAEAGSETSEHGPSGTHAHGWQYDGMVGALSPSDRNVAHSGEYISQKQPVDRRTRPFDSAGRPWTNVLECAHVWAMAVVAEFDSIGVDSQEDGHGREQIERKGCTRVCCPHVVYNQHRRTQTSQWLELEREGHGCGADARVAHHCRA